LNFGKYENVVVITYTKTPYNSPHIPDVFRWVGRTCKLSDFIFKDNP